MTANPLHRTGPAMALALSLSLFLAACGGDGATPATAGAGAQRDAVAAAQAAVAAGADTVASDPQLADPRVGDLYAARLNAFSVDNFGSENDVFGLLKVVDVQPDKIVVITETSGWENGRGARNDLRGDLKDITWDEEERITLMRNELAGLLANKDIIETRRP